MLEIVMQMPIPIVLRRVDRNNELGVSSWEGQLERVNCGLA